MINDASTDKTFQGLVILLKSHYSPHYIEVSERYKFNSRIQQSTESAKDFIIVLKQLSVNCNFRTFLDEALRDRLIVGLRD